MARPTILGISAVHPVGLRVGLLRRLRLVLRHCHSARISAARCARRHTTVASTLTSRHLGWFLFAGIRSQGFLRCRVDIDLAVVGPMARTAADLALALEIIAGPDEARGAVAYRLELPPSRHEQLKSFRVLVLDAHPLLPTATPVRTAIEGLSQQLVNAGATVADSSPLLPNFANSARLYMRLLMSVVAARWPSEQFKRAQVAADALTNNDNSLAAERLRGAVLSHHDWMMADAARALLQRQWRQLFREWDVVVCPAMPTAAFPHDHSSPDWARHIKIDGKQYSYSDQLVWPEIATTPGLPATAIPIGHPNAGLPIGVQIVGPHLEDRTTLAFAALLEREFGGFTPPPGY